MVGRCVVDGLSVVAAVPVEEDDGGGEEERKEEALSTAAAMREQVNHIHIYSIFLAVN